MNEQNANKQTTRTRNQIEAHIIANAWKDETYKKELLNNPRAVIEREFNVKLPSDVNVIVMEENSSNFYFVLPMRPNFSRTELSDEQLEAVAGGIAPLIGVAAIGAGVVGGTFTLGAVDGFLENRT
jgi:hypothetical protein